MMEAGVPDFEVSIWIGALVPHATPAARVARLNAAIVQALGAPEVSSPLRRVGYDPVGSSPGEMQAVIKTQTAMWAKVVKAAGIHAD